MKYIPNAMPVSQVQLNPKELEEQQFDIYEQER